MNRKSLVELATESLGKTLTTPESNLLAPSPITQRKSPLRSLIARVISCSSWTAQRTPRYWIDGIQLTSVCQPSTLAFAPIKQPNAHMEIYSRIPRILTAIILAVLLGSPSAFAKTGSGHSTGHGKGHHGPHTSHKHTVHIGPLSPKK